MGTGIVQENRGTAGVQKKHRGTGVRGTIVRIVKFCSGTSVVQ